jgi:hypothetical protein
MVDSCSPGTPSAEVCDGIDNNCDGTIDEGVTPFTYYMDADSDSYGDANITVRGCVQPEGYVRNNTDCNDGNQAINPGATEVPNNGIDEDCNSATPAISVSGSANNYPIPNFRASMSVNVNESSLGTSTLSYYYTRNRLYFTSGQITGMVVDANTGIATITGSGKVNGVTGYTFTAIITDGNPDKMGITILTSGGATYYRAVSSPVASGNFTFVTGQ